MICTITIVRYPVWLGWAGILSMAVFRLPLRMKKDLCFWKLLGSGKNGSFDKEPDWLQWGVLGVWNKATSHETRHTLPKFLLRWWQFFNCEIWTVVLEPIEGHGTWDGKACFGVLPKNTDYDGRIGILTRATIRISKLSRFWKNVGAVSDQMVQADGLITSLGIGEIPWIKQATFSIWDSKTSMKKFAYQLKEHEEVIKKTRAEKWYREEMFVRFKILNSSGTILGKNPLERML